MTTSTRRARPAGFPCCGPGRFRIVGGDERVAVVIESTIETCPGCGRRWRVIPGFTREQVESIRGAKS